MLCCGPMSSDTVLPVTIFLISYAVLAAGKLPPLRLDRAGAALVGAVAMVICGALSSDAAHDAIDFPTILLLLGMMIVVANLRLSGAFSLAAAALLVRARSPRALLAMTVALSGVLAAFFINDVVCLVLAPVLIEMVVRLRLDPLPYLLALATAANIGSMATITGNPQNMIVAGFADLDYLRFTAHLAPIAVVALAVDYAVLVLLYRDRLDRPWPTIDRLRDRGPIPVSRPLLYKSVAASLGALLGFAAGLPTHLVALTAGAWLLLTRRVKPERVYREIDWTMLLMFAGLFVVVGGLEATGVQNAAIEAIGSERLSSPPILAGVVVVLSNLVSNVPAVLLFRPIFPLLGNGEQVGLLLASVSTLAGNLTVLASVANLIVIEQARRRGVRISFFEYLKVGVPVTILTVILDVAVLSLLA